MDKRKKTNRVIDRRDSYLLVEDNQGRTFKISPEDEYILDMYWSVRWSGANWYVKREVREKTKSVGYYLHRVLLGIDSGMCVDHINHDTTDNTRENMRPSTPQENARNSNGWAGKKYKGTFLDKRRNKWNARIKVNYKYKYLGSFDTEDEAALAYNKSAVELFGTFKNLNQVK